MLTLKAKGAKEASERRREQARRASNPAQAGSVVHEVLAANATPVSERTGRLSASLQPGHPEHRWQALGSTFTFGSAVPYAKYYFAAAGQGPVQPGATDEAARALKAWIVDGD